MQAHAQYALILIRKSPSLSLSLDALLVRSYRPSSFCPHCSFTIATTSAANGCTYLLSLQFSNRIYSSVSIVSLTPFSASRFNVRTCCPPFRCGPGPGAVLFASPRVPFPGLCSFQPTFGWRGSSVSRLLLWCRPVLALLRESRRML